MAHVSKDFVIEIGHRQHYERGAIRLNERIGIKDYAVVGPEAVPAA